MENFGRICFILLLCAVCALLVRLSYLELQLRRVSSELTCCKLTRDYLQKERKDGVVRNSDVSSAELPALQSRLDAVISERDVKAVMCEQLQAKLTESDLRLRQTQHRFSDMAEQFQSYQSLVESDERRFWYAYRKWSVTDFLSIQERLPVFSGVYVFLNETTGQVLVQLADDVVQQVVRQLSGGGSVDLRRDLVAKHMLSVVLFPYEGCGYASVQDLCSELAVYYHVYVKGYRGSYGK